MIGINVDNNKFDWGESMRQYQIEKKSLPYDFPKQRDIVTHKQIKELDLVYNPILQTYRNKTVEQNMKNQEKENLINTIARNADKAMRVEQSFNVISLQVKLKGYENHPKYPKEKLQNLKRQLETTRVNYNILSTIPLDKHHYRKPEERPIVHEDVNNIFTLGKES
jgi:hypothetical protein